MKNVIREKERGSEASQAASSSARKADKSKKVGIAFQGGSFLAGAVHTGVVRALVERGAFAPHSGYTLAALSGTSAGAIVATLCWKLALEDKFWQAPGELSQLWLYNANSSIPNQEWGDFWKSFDSAARANPFYDIFMDVVRTTWLHGQFKDWIMKFIPPGDAIQSLWHKRGVARPHLALGATEVLKGGIITFTDRAFLEVVKKVLAGEQPQALSGPALAAGSNLLVNALMASGSLDEINGTTTIDSGDYAGTYLDGAWGQNPPIDALTDFDVDEIWIIEIFNKERSRAPATHAEREDRKEELWQNSLVEQQVHTIEKINEWINKGLLTGTKHRPIEVRRVPMTLDFTPGARIVNTPCYLIDKMNYGYRMGLDLMNSLGLQTTVKYP